MRERFTPPSSHRAAAIELGGRNPAGGRPSPFPPVNSGDLRSPLVSQPRPANGGPGLARLVPRGQALLPAPLSLLAVTPSPDGLGRSVPHRPWEARTYVRLCWAWLCCPGLLMYFGGSVTNRQSAALQFGGSWL